jgi:hypothetical protein
VIKKTNKQSRVHNINIIPHTIENMHPTNAKDLVRRALLSGCTTVEECAEWIVENEEGEGGDEEEEEEEAEGTSSEHTNSHAATTDLSTSHADNTAPSSAAASTSSATVAASAEKEEGEDGESEFTEVLPKVDEKLLETILGFGFPEVIPQ